MKVLKFGGSTIKDPKMIKKVGEIIRSTYGEAVIVTSALYGQTNEIREYIKNIQTEKEEIDKFIKNIRSRHIDFTNRAIENEGIQNQVINEMEKHILKLERLLYGVTYTEELTPQTTDLILSSGERMSAYLMEGVLRNMEMSAKAFEADQIGIITDGVFCNATADLISTEKVLKKTIMPFFKKGITPVITGFFGCDYEGRCTTFGRNGSDYSAAVIANALNAEVLELWKDVDGFMSADPNIVPNAYTINKLSYNEAAELAHFGISLLHPRTVEPVGIKEIPIVIKNIQAPNNEGTRIVKKGFRTGEVIKSVAYSTDLVELKISSAGGGYRPGVLSAVTSELNNSNINIYSVATSQTQLSILINKSDRQAAKTALEKIETGLIEHIDFQKDIALVCVVGEGAHKTKGLAGKIFSAVANASVNVEVISAGASKVASHFTINKNDLKKTIIAIHDTFCNN